MDLFAAINTRTSASRLTEPVPDGVQLTRILEAAVRAPDHGHFAPWRFLIIEHEARERLANVVAEARLIRTPDATPEALEAERQKIRRAPMIILVACATQINHPKIPEIEQLLAVGAAVQNLLLAAHASGFGAVWKTGPAAYDAHVKQALGLQPTDHIVAMVHIGTPLAVNPLRAPQLAGIVKHL